MNLVEGGEEMVLLFVGAIVLYFLITVGVAVAIKGKGGKDGNGAASGSQEGDDGPGLR